MTINTHGFNIDLESLKNVAARTEKCCQDLHQTISIDLETGEVLYWCGMSGNWVEYRDPAVAKLFSTRRKYDVQALADAIARSLAQYRHDYEYFGDKCEDYVFRGEK